MKKAIIVILTIVLISCMGVVSYLHFKGGNDNKLENFYTKSEIYLSKNTKYTNLPDYFNFEGIEYEKISLEELKNRLGKYKVTCGLESMPEYSFGSDCLENANDYMMYLENGIPYFIHSSVECDENGGCTTNENYYDVAKFAFIKNVKSIVSKIDQYNGSDAGSEFAFELENGDVYYFTPLYDPMVVDGEERYAHLIKVELSSKLVKFSNIENGQITYGTDIVLELENNEKYVLQYDYKTNKVSLMVLSEYEKKYLSNDVLPDNVKIVNNYKVKYIDNTISQVLKPNSNSEKLDLKNVEFISPSNYEKGNSTDYFNKYNKIDDFDLDPMFLVNSNVIEVIIYVSDEESDFIVYKINMSGTPKVIEGYYTSDDSSMYYLYVLYTNNELYRYSFTYEDPSEIVKTKIDIKSVESISNIYDETDGEVPLANSEYIIIKTKDGKYYKDYSYENELVELKGDNPSYIGEYEANAKEGTFQLILRDDNTFVYNINPVSYAPLVGTYKVSGSKITLNGKIKYNSACYYTNGNSIRTINATIKNENVIIIQEGETNLEYKKNTSFVEKDVNKKRYVTNPVNGKKPSADDNEWTNCDNN